MDELRIYNRGLSGTEVEDLHEKKDITSGLIAYYPFDENYADMSSNSHDIDVIGENFLAYTILAGDSNYATSISAKKDNMLVGTRSGISNVNTDYDELIESFSTDNGLLSNLTSSLDVGSLIYGTENHGAGLLDFDEAIVDVITALAEGGPTSWSWAKAVADGLVRCGDAQYWEWKTFSECNQKIPNGTATDWKWVEK